MKHRGCPLGLFVFVLAAFSTFAAEYQPVTDARLVSPEPENWLMYRGTYDSHGYSPLKRINTRNVKRLKPLWTYSTRWSGSRAHSCSFP